MRSGVWLAITLALAICGAANSARSQTLLTDALSWFPPQTVSLQYSQPAMLTNLPNYQSLRARYLGRNLRILEQSLESLGIHESDIDQMVLGFESASGNEMQYDGLATGRFDAQDLARRAAASGIAPHSLGQDAAYCLPQDPNHTCIAVIEAGTIGLFGPLPILQSIVKARDDQGSSIASNTRFIALARSAQSSAPIWGVATGAAVSKWFKAWMPGEKNVQMDWARAFQGVDSLSYQIRAGDNVDLSVKLNCTSERSASSIRQLLDGLRLIQQLAWQGQNPGQANPFQNLAVGSSGTQVTFQLTADFAALERAGPLGKP